MLNSKLNLALAAALSFAGVTAAFAQKESPLVTQTEDQLIAVLKSDAAQKEKADACRQLGVIGTKKAIEALAALLPDETLNHMARYGLETMPDPAVDDALRAALPSLKGRPLIGVIGSIMLPIFRYSVTPESKDYEKTDERIIQEGTELIPCPTGAAVLGELQVVTPWGASTTARPSGTGVAVFAVDWGIERAGELSKDQLATAWQVTAPTLKLAARWTPSAGETDRLAKLVAAASARVVVGATAPQIEATIEAGGKGIQIGGTGQLVLTVQNKGGSTATKLTAKTRSSMPALHGLTFSFGTVQPGASASRTQEVKIADDVLDDSATILVIFSEGGGHAPAELTKILPLARAVCPGGRLTRQKYDEKRTKLKRAVAAGDMSKEDFEKYDAELLRCLD